MVDTMRSYNQFKDPEGKVHTIYQGRDMVVVNGSKYYSLNYLTSKETTMVNTMNREELEMEILKNDSLYKRFNKERFLNRKYTDKELIDVMVDWLVEGDEGGSL